MSFLRIPIQRPVSTDNVVRLTPQRGRRARCDDLEELRGLNKRLWEVAADKYLVGITNAEVARGLGLSETAIEKHWTFARA